MKKSLENVFDEILESLKNTNGYPYAVDDTDYDLIKNALKAFEIIDEKDVNVLTLKYAFISLNGIEYYNKHFENKNLHLTQEEFDLLKEVLYHYE